MKHETGDGHAYHPAEAREGFGSHHGICDLHFEFGGYEEGLKLEEELNDEVVFSGSSK